MSRTFKHFTKLACLVLSILLFTISCSKDEPSEIVIQTSKQSLPYSIKTVSYNDFNDLHLLKEINKFSHSNNIEDYNPEYDLYIDLNHVKYIESNDGSHH